MVRELHACHYKDSQNKSPEKSGLLKNYFINLLLGLHDHQRLIFGLVGLFLLPCRNLARFLFNRGGWSLYFDGIQLGFNQLQAIRSEVDRFGCFGRAAWDTRFFVGFFSYYAVLMTYDSWRFHDMAQGVLPAPLWIPQLGYSAGLVILFIAFVDEFVHVVRGNSPRYEKPKPQTAEEVVEQAIQSGV